MSNRVARIIVAAVLVLVLAAVAVLRGTRTEHPPVASAPPRIDPGTEKAGSNG